MLTVVGIPDRLFRRLRAFRPVFANRDLRRVLLAFLLFGMAKWGFRISILVFAYERGGPAETGLVAAIQLFPAAVTAPLASVLGDRLRRDRALVLGYAIQTVAVGGTAAALLLEAPMWVVYMLIAVVAASVTLTRPVQSALFPQLARSPDELTAANVVAGLIWGAFALAGPAIAGILIGTGDIGLVFAVFALFLLGATLLVVRLEPRPPPHPSHEQPLKEAAAGFAAVARHPDQRLVVGLLAGQSMLAGAMDVLLVVIALDLLDLPSSAAGYLTAARGAGGLVGGLWSMGLVGKRHLAAPLGGSQLVYGTSAAGLALSAIPLLTGALVMSASAGYTRADTAGRVLLQRVVPDPILTRVFGVLEGLNQAGMAAGAMVAPLLVAVFGIRAGVIAAGLALPAAVALLWTRIRAVDRAADVPERELELIHTLDLFASLSLPTLEGLAARFVPVSVAQGEVVIREGDPGDRFYVIEEGEVAVSLNGRPVATLGPGEYFGEIALLHHEPRDATVTAVTPTSLLTLNRVEFLEAVTRHPHSREVAEATVRERLANEDQDPAE
jgi:MFS family permease